MSPVRVIRSTMLVMNLSVEGDVLVCHGVNPALIQLELNQRNGSPDVVRQGVLARWPWPDHTNRPRETSRGWTSQRHTHLGGSTMKAYIYTLPGCVQCDATKRSMRKNGVAFEGIDLAVNDEIRDELAAQGFMQAPIVAAGNDSWSGYRPEKIKALATNI